MQYPDEHTIAEVLVKLSSTHVPSDYMPIAVKLEGPLIRSPRMYAYVSI